MRLGQPVRPSRSEDSLSGFGAAVVEISGDFDEAKLESLCALYLGTLQPLQQECGSTSRHL